MKSAQLLKYEMLAEFRLNGSQLDCSLRSYEFKSQYLCSVRAHEMWPSSATEVALAILYASLSLCRVSTERTGVAVFSCKWSRASCSPCRLSWSLPLSNGQRPNAAVSSGTDGKAKTIEGTFTILRAHQINCKMYASDLRLTWPAGQLLNGFPWHIFQCLFKSDTTNTLNDNQHHFRSYDKICTFSNLHFYRLACW
jgi:hypothetical protein